LPSVITEQLFKKTAMKKSMVIEIISGLLALLFMYAAISKLLDYSTFRIQLNQSPFITRFANVIVWALPVIEITVAVLLALQSPRLPAFYAALFLLSLFTAYLIAMLNFSYYIPCSCGGVLASLSWKQHIILNAGFIVLSLAGIQLQSMRENGSKKVKQNM
jgi:uncharacterized membrane protein YphA (DoxX/SURF4 family)